SAGFGLVSTGSMGRQVLLHRLMHQIFIDRSGENRVRQIERSDHFVFQILYVNCCHPTLPSGFFDEHLAAGRTGHRPADEKEIVFLIDSGDDHVANSYSRIPHVAGHPHPLNDSRRESGSADRTGSAVKHRTMCGPAAAKVMTLDQTRESAAFAGSDDV